MFQIPRSIGFYLVGLIAMANIALTANCFDTPTFTFYDKIYDDVWAARATLCTKGAPGISCGDSFGSTIRCQVKVGNVYAAMEGTTGKAGSDDMYKYCMVHNSLRCAAACVIYD